MDPEENYPNTKSEIIQSLTDSFLQVDLLFEKMNDNNFTKQPMDKWSPAEQLQHLILSTNPLTLGLKLPKASLRIFGTNSGKSKTYQEVMKNYTAQLDQGAKATFLYTPKKINSSRTKMLSKWKTAYSKLLKAIDKWTEEELDKYQLKHPLLGKMTVREMLFFTNYHTQHHTKSVSSLIDEANE